MNSIEKKRAHRLKFINALYDVVDGLEGQFADMSTFLSELDLDFDKEEDFNEFQSIARYLKGEGLIETIDVESGTIVIGEVRAAYAASRIAQLYATPQDVVVASDAQEPPRCGKDQLKQNDYAGLCIRVSGKIILLGSSVNRDL